MRDEGSDCATAPLRSRLSKGTQPSAWGTGWKDVQKLMAVRVVGWCYVTPLA